MAADGTWVFVASGETALVEGLRALRPPLRVHTVPLHAGDVMICTAERADAMSVTARAPVYNPALHYNMNVASLAEIPGLDPGLVYVPQIVLERKTATDLSSSVTGASEVPDVSRYHDQTLRLARFRRLSGAKVMWVVEGYHQYASSVKIGSLDMHRFRQVLLSKWMDGTPPFDVRHVDETVLLVRDLVHRIESKAVANRAFWILYEAIQRDQRASGTGPLTEVPESLVVTVGSQASPSDQSDAEFAAAAARAERQSEVERVLEHVRSTYAHRPDLTPGVDPRFDDHDAVALGFPSGPAATRGVVTNHSQAIRVAKKGNRTAALQYQSMLMSVLHLRDVSARAIMAQFPTMAALVRAYERAPAHERPILLQDVGASEPGARRHLRLGPARSKALWRTLYGLDDGVEEAPEEGDDDDDDGLVVLSSTATASSTTTTPSTTPVRRRVTTKADRKRHRAEEEEEEEEGYVTDPDERAERDQTPPKRGTRARRPAAKARRTGTKK
jgi:ERCC4-type nuclease